MATPIVPTDHPARMHMEAALDHLASAISRMQDLPELTQLSIGTAYDQVHGLLHTPGDDQEMVH